MEENQIIKKKGREFGRAFLTKKNYSSLTKRFYKKKQSVWMSHEDAVVKLPKNFKGNCFYKDSKFTIIENTKVKSMGYNFIQK